MSCWHAPCGRTSAQHRRFGRHHRAAVCGARGRRGVVVERTDLPGRAVWRPLFVAPLAIPAFVNSYAWVGVVPSLHGLGGGVLISTLSYFPFVYLPAAATPPARPGRRGRRALGSGSAGVFFRVVAPQCGWRSSAADC